VEANRTGGQGSRRAVAPSDDNDIPEKKWNRKNNAKQKSR
jgi:hypothetical protein